MGLPSRKKNRLENFDYGQNGAYFITICVKDRCRILSDIVGTPVLGCPQIKLLNHGKIAEKYLIQLNEFYANISVDKYIIMPDHIHLLLSINNDGHPRTGVPTRTSIIARFVGTFKRFCNKEYGENIWQPRYYDHIIRNQQDYNKTFEYIENNPTNWILKHKKAQGD